MEAIRLIRIVANHIATNQAAFETLSGDDVSNIPLADRVWLRGWFPLMFELSAVIRYNNVVIMFHAYFVFGKIYVHFRWFNSFEIVNY